MFRKNFHPKGLTVDMFYQVVRKDCFGSGGDAKQFLVKVFRRLGFLADKERSAKESQAMFSRVVVMEIYMYIHI